MKNFNWGHGITLFYVIFVLALITVLVASTRIDHSLVDDDYYAKDIAYQKQYNKEVNVLNDQSIEIEIDRTNEAVLINFKTDKTVDGKINFYRASDKSKDFSIAIKGTQNIIPTGKIPKGKWKVKVDWTEGEKPYYHEKDIFL